MVTQAQAPASFAGSLPEYAALQALIRLGKQPGIDFDFQSPLMGGRLSKGGVILDFLFFDPPDLAINIQGIYYHYGFGPEVKARDIIAREQMAGRGVTLIFVDEDDILSNADFYMREALQYRDHSRLTRGA